MKLAKFPMLLILTITSFTGFQIALGDTVGSDFGIIEDLLPSGDRIFFFETDHSIKSPYWIHDTRIMVSDFDGTRKVSDELFIFPTNLKQNSDYLFFTVLSDTCVNSTICDYQDIIKMSKSDGSYQKIIKDLKSAAHISIGDSLFVSESNGKIWKISLDGKSRHLLTESQNIIMDIVSNGDEVYWIEEIEDMNNKIMRIKDGNIETLATDLKIPYDLGVYDNILHWNEIQVKPERGAFAEFTVIKRYQENSVVIIDEYENTSPVSVPHIPHYGPYLQYGSYIFVVNNTKSSPEIHLIETNSKTKFDIVSVDYNIRYLRADDNNLYVIGQNNNGFMIEKFPLPVAIPEFSSMLVFTTSVIGLSLLILLKQSFHY
ncbi:MAG: hypothetical protein AABW61_01120 [Candidatus Aenigmatarchaeota archaeon]